jgi:hypothetical protein
MKQAIKDKPDDSESEVQLITYTRGKRRKRGGKGKKIIGFKKPRALGKSKKNKIIEKTPKATAKQTKKASKNVPSNKT